METINSEKTQDLLKEMNIRAYDIQKGIDERIAFLRNIQSLHQEYIRNGDEKRFAKTLLKLIKDNKISDKFGNDLLDLIFSYIHEDITFEDFMLEIEK